MYNSHRGIPQPPSNNNNNRLSELFDQIRREFEVHAQDRAGEHDQNSKYPRLPQYIHTRFDSLLNDPSCYFVFPLEKTCQRIQLPASDRLLAL